MRFWKKNDGLTLVELIVSMAIGTMIFAAATTVLLLGIRIHRHTTDSIMQQYTARTTITVMEKIASEGDLGKIVNAEDGSWWTYGKDGEQVLLFYSAETKTIYSGDSNAPLLDGVMESGLTYDKQTGVLTITLKDEKNSYSSSVFCRTLKEKETSNPFPVFDENESRAAFLAVLKSQMRDGEGNPNIGKINHTEEKTSLGKTSCDCADKLFFSEWYIGEYTAENEWDELTPWCSCFVSWGLVKAGLDGPEEENVKWFANVDAFMSYLKKKSAWSTLENVKEGKTPKVGDLVFFGAEDDPSHVGAILSIEGRMITTIEGNVEVNSQHIVTKKTYEMDEALIIGYGDPWAAQTN